MNIPRNKYNLITGALALLLLVATIAAIQMKEKYDENDVFVRNLKLFTGSRQFFIKGVNYSPQPLGRANEAGLCSKKINHEGVYYDACIFEDYFDGVNSDNGGSPHPSGPWWREVWRRDFPLMRDMGANTMRVYHMSPFTKELIEKYPTIYSKYVPYKQYAPEHRTFMDTAAEYGLKVIVPIVSEESILTLYSEDDLNRFVEARVDEIGNHSALLMWVVGNELGLYSKPDLRALVNKMIIKVREYTLERWNRIIPVTTCEVDLPQSYNILTDEIDVDIFMTNAGYRDVFINTLWEPDTNNNFVGWEAKSKEFGLPVLVGEFGMHDQDSQTAGRPDWINQQYRPMVQYMTKGSIGGLFFEFNEETLKPPNQQQMGLVRFAPNSEKQGEDSTMVGVFVPDRAYKKDIVFEAIAQGLADSSYKEWNFKNSEYDLAGVKQIGLDLTQITPRPFGHNFPGSGEDGAMPEVSLSPLPSTSYPPSPSYSSSPVPKPSPSESTVKPEPTPSKSKSTPGTQESSILPRESTGSHSHNDSSSFYYKAALYTALFLGSVVSLLHIWH